MMAETCILITGGAGYIGSHVCKMLAACGYAPLVADNLSTGHREFVRWGAFVSCDLDDIEQLRSIFQRHPIAAVMHFAASAYVGESVFDPQRYYCNNVRGTLNLLQVMLEHDVRKLIFSSSCATYGAAHEVPITESHPQVPVNPYGASKLFVERILRDYDVAYGLRSVALRFFNAAGADPDAEIGERHTPETHLIPLVLDVAAGLREHIVIFGDDYPTSDGTCVRDFIHVNDIADAHIKSLEYLLGRGGTDQFNLGNGSGFSVREVIAACERVTGKAVNAVLGTRRAGDPPVLISCSQKASRILGWQPTETDLEKIVASAWRWHGCQSMF